MSSISAISNILDTNINKDSLTTSKSSNNNAIFENVLQSAMDMVNETNSLTNSAEEEEIKYAIGESDSPLDLMVAQQKANYAVSYTVAVRNAVLDAYKEILNLQF